MAKGLSHFCGDHDSGIAALGSKLLGQGEHGGGFACLAGGMDNEIAFLGDEAINLETKVDSWP